MGGCGGGKRKRGIQLFRIFRNVRDGFWIGLRSGRGDAGRKGRWPGPGKWGDRGSDRKVGRGRASGGRDGRAGIGRRGIWRGRPLRTLGPVLGRRGCSGLSGKGGRRRQGRRGEPVEDGREIGGGGGRQGPLWQGLARVRRGKGGFGRLNLAGQAGEKGKRGCHAAGFPWGAPSMTATGYRSFTRIAAG